MEDVASAWALKETEERIPDGKNIPEDENGETKGTETGKPGTSSRTDNGCRAQRENGALCESRHHEDLYAIFGTGTSETVGMAGDKTRSARSGRTGEGAACPEESWERRPLPKRPMGQGGQASAGGEEQQGKT